MNILITGSSRGIGSALVRQALSKGHAVFAVARDTTNLRPLQAEFASSLKLIEANISQPEGIAMVVKEMHRAGKLDVLINNAGVFRKEETAEAFSESFHVNAATPFLVTKALLPLLAQSNTPKVVQITSLMGSIADNSSGGSYAYRASKSALNMITKSFAVDHPQISFVVIHPGWVKTDMGGAEAPLEITDSASGIWNVIDTFSTKESGGFKDFKSRDLSW